MKELERYFERHRNRIIGELLSGTYRPQPVKRAEIPKPDGGVRKLGTPTALDRVNHDVLMSRVANRVSDKRLLKRIRAFLNSGVLVDGLFNGTPQGGLLSPIVS